MKKTLFLLCTMGFLLPSLHTSVLAIPNVSRQEVQIKEATIPAKPIRGRSAIPSVEVWIDYDMGSIEVLINESLGDVTISISDMFGRVISCERVNSEIMPYIMFAVPNIGLYNLVISGHDYYAEGEMLIK